MEKQVNIQILFLFGILLLLSVGSAVGSFIRTVSCPHRALKLVLYVRLTRQAHQYSFADDMWYLLLSEKSGNKARAFVEDVLTFIILYNNLIPIR